MDDDRDEDEEQPWAFQSGQVRIIGAEPVGQHAAPPPEAAPTSAFDDEVPDWPKPEIPLFADPDAVPPSPPPTPDAVPFDDPDLPHWTEAPTGEVPAVLSRHTGEHPVVEDPWATLPAPTWREGESDWDAQSGSYEPSMLAHDQGRLGSLDDSGEAERQPWSFDLPATREPELRPGRDAPVGPGFLTDGGLTDDPAEDTMVVPAVRRSDPAPETPAPPPPAPPPPAAPTPAPETPAPETPALQTPAAPTPAASTPAPPTPSRSLFVDDADEADDVDGVHGVHGVDRRASDVGADEPAGRQRPPPRGQSRSDRAAPRSGRRRGRPAPAPEPAAAPLSASAVAATAAGASAAGRPVPKAPPRDGGASRLRAGVLRPPTARQESGTARSGRNMPVAVATGVALGILALVFFALGTVPALIITAAVTTLAAAEAFAAFRKGGYQPATLLGLVATLSLMVATYNKGQAALGLIVVLTVAFTFVWHLAGVERGADPVRGTASTLLVFCWVGVFASFAALLLDPTLFPHRHGIAFLLGAIITAVAYDVGALVVGGWIGRHPLAPDISPHKTWEGVAGGAVAAVLGAVIVVHLIHPWTIGAAAALGVVVSVVSPLGDLSESMVKRHLGLKDMGHILPGHGGLLDRVDGLLFVLPATYFLVKALQIG